MRENLKWFNLAILFFLELTWLVLLGIWGYHFGDTVLMKYLLAICTPLAAAVIWGLIASPKAKHRLPQPYRIIFALAVFFLAASLVYSVGYHNLAIIFASLCLMSELIAYNLE